MRYEEITRLITGSSPDDWVVLTPGPYVPHRAGEGTYDGQRWLHDGAHDYLAVYRPDVDLRLAWGLTLDAGLAFDGWDFPDPRITRLLVDGLWRGALVARWTVLRVDGNRCYLPDPDQPCLAPGSGAHDLQAIGWTANASDVALAWLLYRLVHGGQAREFGSYLERIGAIEIPPRVTSPYAEPDHPGTCW